jgi:protein-disulfide isomerase
MMLRILYGTILIVALLLGWRLFEVHAAKRIMTTATLGQSFGASEKDAKSTLVEIMDYRCSYCREMAPVIEEVIRQHPETRIVIRHLPIFGKPSIHEADFALAAGMQGKFAEAHRALVARSEPLPDDEYEPLAVKLGLNYNKLKTDMSGPVTGQALLDTVDAAQDLGINSAPSFIVNGRVIQTKNLDHLPTAEEIGGWLAGKKPREIKSAAP